MQAAVLTQQEIFFLPSRFLRSSIQFSSVSNQLTMLQCIKVLSIALFVGLAQARNDTVVKGWVAEPDGRGTWSILWSSLVTVFLCTWSVLHLTVRKQGRWRLFLRKCKYMLGTVLVPELTLTESVRAFLEARRALPYFVRYGSSEWTMTHVQFDLSDGFEILYTDGRSKVTCRNEIIELLAKGEISPQPPISEGELQSRSNSNWLVKLIALLQILWFALQTLFRAIQHIQVTPLELLVVAFIFCSIFTYMFSWNTPQNVEYTVSIPLKAKTSRDETEALSESQEEVQDQQEGSKLISIPKTVRRSASRENDVRQPSRGVEGREYDPSRPNHRPVELPENQKFKDFSIIIAILMTLFGAIHCLAWNSPFPSLAEQLSWRICSLITTSLPAFFCCVVGFCSSDRVEEISDGDLDAKKTLYVVTLMISYAVPRLILIVLTFTALREQPPDAYQTVTWTQYLPNIAA